MDFFQTIWTALTTPNQILTNIIIMPFSFIEITISMLLFTTILNISTSKKNKLIYIITLSIWTILSNILIPKPLGPVINMIILPIVVKFVFNTTILKSILAEFIPTVIIVLIETLVSKIFFNIFDMSYEMAASIPISRISIALTVYFIMFLIYLFSKKSSIFKKEFLDTLDKKSKILLIINFIFALVAMATQFYLIVFYNAKLPSFIILFSMLSLIAYFVISIYSLVRTTQFETASMNLEQSKMYNKTLINLNDSIRGFKHDFQNIMQTIGGYVQSKDMKGLTIYYSEIFDDCNKINNLNLLSPDVVNNPAIYSLLTNKYYKADSLNIKINFEIFLDLNSISMKIYEFTRVIGILLDNAIEAANTCDKKEVNLIIRKDGKSPRQLVIIENTYSNKDVNTDKIFEKGYTSKTDNEKPHGLGLYEVRQILKRNTNLNLFTTKNEEYFKQQLEIYMK